MNEWKFYFIFMNWKNAGNRLFIFYVRGRNLELLKTILNEETFYGNIFDIC